MEKRPGRLAGYCRSVRFSFALRAVRGCSNRSLGTNTPLIAAKAAGPLAYVTHEEDGLLVEIDDAADLARSINRAIGDKYLRSHLVLNGRTQYEKKFTKDVFKANVAALYNSLMR
ncbi:MAG: hypothetical protein H6856_08195 [Rhodospirillales bacterium]|nr:hypothetical protein [Rhodospirillales bacterium]